MEILRLGVQLLWWLPAAQGRSVPAPAALSPSEKPSEHSESWRTQVYYPGRLRGDLSPKSEPWRGVSQGFYGLILPGPCLADWSENWQSNRRGSEFYRSRCVGEGWLEVVDWVRGSLAGFCLVFMAGVSPFNIFVGTFFPTQSDLQPLSYTTATAMQDPSRICYLPHSSWQHHILNPLSEARDRTCILLDTSRVC